MEKHILVIIDDPKYSELALAKAQFLAESFALPLKVVAFTYQSTENLPIELSNEQLTQIKSQSLQQLQSFIEKAAETLSIASLNIDVIWHKHPADYLSQNVSFKDVPYVVKARQVEEHYSTLDWQLIRNLDAPLFLVADKKWKKKPNVFIALDLGSKQSAKVKLNEKVINYGKQLAEAKQSKLSAGYAIGISPILRDMGFVFAEEEELKALDKIPSNQKALIDTHQLSNTLAIKAGIPEQVLTSMTADSDSTLVVIGSVGRKGLIGQLIGNTAEKVLKLLKTDVLILSPDSDD